MNKTEEKLFIESVFDEFSLNVKAMAKYILKDEDLAEKAVYRTFVKIIMNMKLFDDVESEDFRRLVVVFLRCSCYEILRKKRRIEYGQKFEAPETYNNYGTWNKILKKSTLRWLKNTFTSSNVLYSDNEGIYRFPLRFTPSIGSYPSFKTIC